MYSFSRNNLIPAFFTLPRTLIFFSFLTVNLFVVVPVHFFKIVTVILVSFMKGKGCVVAEDRLVSL